MALLMPLLLEEWKSDVMFAVDIMEKLNELNVKLQGNSIFFAHEMYVHVKVFQQSSPCSPDKQVKTAFAIFLC